jgi:hypothetical protein
MMQTIRADLKIHARKRHWLWHVQHRRANYSQGICNAAREELENLCVQRVIAILSGVAQLFLVQCGVSKLLLYEPLKMPDNVKGDVDG